MTRPVTDRPVSGVTSYALAAVPREAREANGQRYLEQQFAGLSDEMHRA